MEKTFESIYKELLEAVEKLPKEAIEKASKEITRKGYDTTGYQYQFLVNVMNEVCGIDGWGYGYSILKEKEGAWSNGKGFFEITTDVKVYINIGDKKIERVCAGGHKSEMHADALKGAITNGLKKTLAMFGVGRRAYEGTIDDDYRPIPQSNEKVIQIDDVGICDTCGTRGKISPKTGNPYCPNWKEHKEKGERTKIIPKEQSQSEKDFWEDMPEK